MPNLFSLHTKFLRMRVSMQGFFSQLERLEPLGHISKLVTKMTIHFFMQWIANLCKSVPDVA